LLHVILYNSCSDFHLLACSGNTCNAILCEERYISHFSLHVIEPHSNRLLRCLHPFRFHFQLRQMELRIYIRESSLISNHYLFSPGPFPDFRCKVQGTQCIIHIGIECVLCITLFFRRAKNSIGKLQSQFFSVKLEWPANGGVSNMLGFSMYSIELNEYLRCQIRDKGAKAIEICHNV